MKNSAITIEVGSDEIVQGLDQTLPMAETQKNILKQVDAVMERALAENNPDIATNAIKSLMGVSRISGLALAKFIYTFKFAWANFNRKDTFEDYMEDKIGRGGTTIKRYFKVWEMLVSGDIPKEYCEKLKLHPIKSLVPIANLVGQGYEVPNEKWRAFADAPDTATIGKICRDIKGKKPKKGTLTIELAKDGSIYAWKDGKRFTVGYFNVDDDTPEVQQAIERLSAERLLVK